MSTPAVSTARLRVRAMDAGDRALFHALYSDAETMRYIGRPSSRAENNASFRATLDAASRPRGPWFFTILKKRGGIGIGLCSIRRISLRERSAEIGIMLVRSAYRRGYAKEAWTALIDAAFKALPIDTVWAQYHAANAGIARLAETLGFIAVKDWRPRGARRQRCVRIMRRSAWRTPSDQRGEYCMSNIIGFMENAGRNAAMRYAAREQLLQMMEHSGVATERSALDSLLGVRETMYCQNQKILPPKKKKAPAKKTPAKKAPAKKPAKKAPSKKK